MNKKRRFLGKLIADLQNNSNNAQNNTQAVEPKLQKKRLIAVPMYYNIQPLYEFFLIGEINLELQLDSEEEYFPIGIKQSPLNKWRPFVKAEQFHNRIEMTIDASYQGISEFEFIIQKLQCCSNDIFKQLALYLQGYQQFIRRIKEKMLQNPVPPRLYEYKFQNFLKKATEYVDNLPVDGLYAVSILQLDYTIYNTKRIKFIVSKALAEIVGGVDQAEAAQILLRKGWLEVFGGSQRIMKNIMLLNRLMKEGRQFLTFKIYTVDKILIQVQAEIEIVQSLRTFVDVGFVEIIRFTISPETRSYLYEMRISNNQLKSLPYELYFNNKTFDPLPPSTSLTYSAYNKENPIAKQLQDINDENQMEENQENGEQNQRDNNPQVKYSYNPGDSNGFMVNGDMMYTTQSIRVNNNSGQYSHRSSLDEEVDKRSSMSIKKEEEESALAGRRNHRVNSTTGKVGRRSRSNSNSSNYSNQEIPGAKSIKEIEQQADQMTNEQLKRQSQDQINLDPNSTALLQNRHPNYDKHELDEQYSQKSQAFMEKFYSEQEIQKLKLAQAAAPKKLLFPSIQGDNPSSSQYSMELKNDQSSRADSFDMRSKTSSLSDQLQFNVLSSPEQNVQNITKSEEGHSQLLHPKGIYQNYNLSQNINNNNNNTNKPAQQQLYNQNQYPTSQNYQSEGKFEPLNLFSFTSQKKSQSNNISNNYINQENNNTNNLLLPSQINNQSKQYSQLFNENESALNNWQQEQRSQQQTSYDYYDKFVKSDQRQAPVATYDHQQQFKMQQSQLDKVSYPHSQELKEQIQDEQGFIQHNNFMSYSPINVYGNSPVITQNKSNQNLGEYEQKPIPHQMDDELQQPYKEEIGDDYDIAQHEYFNIFDDESLGYTFEELQQQQRKLHKMIYQQQYY